MDDSVKGAGDAPAKAVRDLDVRELRDVVIDGVYHGVLKAIGFYLLVGLIIALVIAILDFSFAAFR